LFKEISKEQLTRALFRLRQAATTTIDF